MCVSVCFCVCVCLCQTEIPNPHRVWLHLSRPEQRGVEGREGIGVRVSCPIKSTSNSHYCLSPLLYKTYTQRNLETECVSGQRSHGKAKQSNHRKSEKTARVTDNYTTRTCKHAPCLLTSVNLTLMKQLPSVIKHHLLSPKKSHVPSEFRRGPLTVKFVHSGQVPPQLGN